MNGTGKLVEARRARRIAAELEFWRNDNGTPERDREAILAVTTGCSQENQEGPEEIPGWLSLVQRKADRSQWPVL